jgi:Peptidase family M28
MKNNPSLPAASGVLRIALATSLFLLLFVFLGLYQQLPPSAKADNAPPTEFSAARAMKHIEAIAQRPHPIGSAEAETVRNQIVSELARMGLNPEVQKDTVVSQQGAAYVGAATVNNIVARLKGTGGGGKSPLLVGHYDSVPTGPGASDNGSAVALILETLRALKAGPPLQDDVICLFTDGEEVGSLGAQAFVKYSPTAKDAGLVMNFEARGNSGPSIMFETSPGNGRLISETAKAMPHPVTNSLSYEIYKLLPNDTDLTIFKKAGYDGLNFAFIEGVSHYHSQLDRVDQIDQRSLQHQGAYALALTRHFGNLNLDHLKESNAVFFSVLGALLIRYPNMWILPFTVLVLILFIGITILGFKKKRLTVGGLLLGFLMIFLSIIGSFVIVTVTGFVLRRWYSGYNGTPFLIGFVALTMAVMTALFMLFRKRANAQSLAIGGLLWWVLLMVLTSLFLPGASYLFTWPLLFSLIGLGVTFVEPAQDRFSLRTLVLISLCAIPGLLLLPPLIYLINTGLGLGMAGAVMSLVTLLLALLIPQLDLLAAYRRWLLPLASILLCLVCMVIAILTFGYDKQHEKTDNIFYILNADQGKAVWASDSERPDEWTLQFLTDHSERGTLGDYIPMSNRKIIKSEAPAVSLPAPEVSLLDDRTDNDKRTVHLRITSPRHAPMVSIYVQGNTLDATINGKPVASNDSNDHVPFGNQWMINYWAIPDDGVDLILSLKPGQPLKINAMDRTYNLPEIPGMMIKPRPDYIMATPSGYSDSTLITKSFTF